MIAARLKPVRVTTSRPIAAPADRVYAIIADYRTGHPRILPSSIRDLTVLKGGRGAGTLIRFTIRSFGSEKWVHAAVEEPRPGRVLVERVFDEPVVETTFTVEPSGDDHCSVSITTSWTPAGPRALLERLLGPIMLRRAFAEELRQLDVVAREQGAGA